MHLYDEISQYYDSIFPAGDPQIQFILENAGPPVKKLLDVGCGTGGYAVELAKYGYQVTALDADETMLQKLSEKKQQENLPIQVVQGDMLNLSPLFTHPFHLIYCIGNTLVHMDSLEKVQQAIESFYALLPQKGVLILQIINFDRIKAFHIRELPTLENKEKGISFKRHYEMDPSGAVVHFKTVLTIESIPEVKEYQNSVRLYPLLSSELKQALTKTGFRSFDFYGDFDYSPYDTNSFMLVVKAVKL